MDKTTRLTVLTGITIGISALLLVAFGNPTNMGFCIACFLRDISGSLYLHRASSLQYARPEIFGLVLGSFIISSFKKEFKATSGSSGVIRFFLGFLMMSGALVFLGCPLRMVLRLGGGDGKAIFALVGFTLGIAFGCYFLNQGFTLGRSYTQKKENGTIFPIICILLAFLCFFGLIGIAEEEAHAPFFLSLLLAVGCGMIAQRSRFCMVGGIRDYILFRDNHLFLGSFSLFVVVLIGNIILGNFHFSISLSNSIWFILSMALVGLSGALLGGCPLRQLILAGEGNGDSAITVLGMIVGAAISHNFGMASSPTTVTASGKIEVIVGLIFCTLLAIIVIYKQKKELKV
ncbi:MAG: YedE family putative selenium transporter [Sphaerochaetaceae bacterium]